MNKDPIHRRRLVLHGRLKTISLALKLEGVDASLSPADLQQVWKAYLGEKFWPGMSSEDMIRRPDWHDTLLQVEAWAAERGATFDDAKEPE